MTEDRPHQEGDPEPGNEPDQNTDDSSSMDSDEIERSDRQKSGKAPLETEFGFMQRKRKA